MLNRRSFMAASASAGLTMAGITKASSQGAATWKLGNDLANDHPLSIRLAEAAARINQQSNGSIQIEVFANSQLGSDTDMLSQLRSGGIEFLTLPGTILATLVPIASINGIGFAFADYDQVWKAMDGEFGGYIRSAIQKSGLHAFPKMFDNGFRQVTSRAAPISKASDLTGLKIRVPPSPVQVSLFKALGASPTPINFSELYSALQTHVVEAQENPLAVIETAHMFEVQKYCAITNHIWDGFWLLVNARIWNSLSKDQKELIENNFTQSTEDQRSDVRALNASLMDKLKARGMTFNEVDTSSFRTKLAEVGFYKEWKAKYGNDAWSMFERQVGTLG
jgi:TRAP-type transport system periplasmic protein